MTVKHMVTIRHMKSELNIAIVGAGPYGLSIAAHLSAAGVDHCIFGPPMEMWRNHMPQSPTHKDLITFKSLRSAS